AAVSRSTASRALSGSPLISEETRRKVEAAAERLGYRPNRAASALRTRQSRLIGLVLNNLINASFHTIAEVVQRRAAAEGYQVLLCITDADPRREAAFLRTLQDHSVDGVILIGSGRNVTLVNRMIQDGTAVVNLIRASQESAAPSVLAADRDGAYEATRYLLELGHVRIGFIGGPPSTNSGRERFTGYQDALREQGISVDEKLVVQGPFEPAFGRDAVNQLLDTVPDLTALFAANHESVFGILPTLVERGIRIPADLSLVCYEDIPWLRWWRPPITVVDNGAPELAELAVDLLLQQMGRDGGAGGGGRTYRVGAQLVRRGSCRPLR
ncbi:MAG TPA: LacI family DNA-binding transcriptional regulator, partial [Natronosporangium sp.]|nr:LacI family DNA-binding transcriptional regulator [Natronosporangium sp.]